MKKFSLLLCITHAAPRSDFSAPTPTEWAVISVAIGAVGGVLFHLFVGGERNVDRLFISIAGAVILGLVFGYIALAQIKRTGQQGRGLALAAVILGWIGLASTIVVLVVAFSAGWLPLPDSTPSG